MAHCETTPKHAVPRTVPAFVYWILHLLKGGLIFAAFVAGCQITFSLVPTLEMVGAIYLSGAVIDTFADDRQMARHEGRPALSPTAIPASRVALRSVSQGVGLVGEFAFDTAFYTLVLFGLAHGLGRHPVRLFPLSLPLLTLYCLLRLFTRKESPSKRRSIASSDFSRSIDGHKR